MKRLLLLLALLFATGVYAAPGVTVSASAVSILGTSQNISITVQLIDPNNTGMLKVAGTGIVPIMRASTVTPGTTATVGPIYGNDVIQDGYGNFNTTYYMVQVFTVVNGFISSTPSLQNFYAFIGSGTIDLSTATPLAPSFMSGPTGVLIPGNLTVLGVISSGGSAPVSNIIYVGNTAFPSTGAGINLADAALGSAAGTIIVAAPGSYCDAQVLLSNNHTLQFGAGTYFVNIAGVDSSSANVTWGVVGGGSNQTTIESCAHSNLDVITSQHFSGFTTGTNFYGVYHPIIRGLTIDGNKVNESSGYGIRLYSRSPAPADVLTQNCVNDGQWWEWGGTESDTGVGTSVNANGVILESDYNGGNGFTFATSGVSPGSLNAIGNLIAHNNGAWGIQQNYTISVGQINSYNNTSGGCDMHLGALIATNAECDTGTSGKGLWQESGAGGVFIATGVFSGGIPFESDTTSGGVLHGNFANATSGNPCIKLNGAGGLNITATGFGCSTALVNFASEITSDIITFNYAGIPSAVFTGSPRAADSLTLITSGGANYTQVSQPTTYISNLLDSPTAPTISTHFNTSGDSITTNGTSSITVVTGTGAGTTTGSLTMPAAANGWNCMASLGGNIVAESATSSTSVTFTNYNSSLSPTNWPTSASLRILCRAY